MLSILIKIDKHRQHH